MIETIKRSAVSFTRIIVVLPYPESISSEGMFVDFLPNFERKFEKERAHLREDVIDRAMLARLAARDLQD